MKPTRVEIVPARRAGVTGYVSVGRGTALGNPFRIDHGDPNGRADAVDCFRRWFNSNSVILEESLRVIYAREEARKLLDRDWPDGVVRIGCPCNGHEKGQPCHATVIQEFLEAEIAQRK